MKKKEKSYPFFLASTILLLFFIIFSSTQSIITAHSAFTIEQYAYISNMNSDTVSVINTATNTVVANVPVGQGPYGLAVSPDGTKVYVTNSPSAARFVARLSNTTIGTVSVIDTATNTVTSTVIVGQNPFEVVVSPDGTNV